jgi:hypothetical protein
VSVPIPKYLDKIAKIKKTKRELIECDLVCGCGSDVFSVYKNCFSQEDMSRAEEWRKKHNKYWRFRRLLCGGKYTFERDKDTGKIYKIGLFSSLFGIKIGKFCFDDASNLDLAVIKVKCGNCRKEHIVFDNRIHGYDGFCGSPAIDTEYNDIRFERKTEKNSEESLYRVSINIRNDETFDKFIEVCCEADITFEQYTNAFGDIEIMLYPTEILGREICFYAEETR